MIHTTHITNTQHLNSNSNNCCCNHNNGELNNAQILMGFIGLFFIVYLFAWLWENIE